jgi:hypothetical protein
MWCSATSRNKELTSSSRRPTVRCSAEAGAGLVLTSCCVESFRLAERLGAKTRTVRSLPIVDSIRLVAFDRETHEAIVVTLGEDRGRSVP